MNIEQHRKGHLYQSTYSTKPSSFLPKIKTGEFSPGINTIKGKRIAMPYRQLIIKQQEPKGKIKNDLAKLDPEELEERVKASKEYKQLQNQIERMEQKHRQEQLQLKTDQEQKMQRIKSAKKQIYNSKYSMWEINTEIFQLQQQLNQQTQHNLRLLHQLGYEPPTDHELV